MSIRIGLFAFSTLVAVASVAGTPAHAVLIADGITYSLTGTSTANPLTEHFVLQISGINGASDTEGGRSGVNAFAFNKPANYSTATPPTGFGLVNGGLSASGCNGSGAFFCFDANPDPATSPTLPANSTLTYEFDVTLTSGTFAGYSPDFKIDWVGSKNNYDLVSQTLTPTTPPPPNRVPEPATLVLLGSSLAMAGWIGSRRRQHSLGGLPS